MKSLALIAVALASASVAQAADKPAAAPQQCFFTRDLRNHTVGGDKTLYFNIGGRDTYRVEMRNSCLAGAMSSDPIVIRNMTGSTQICRPIDLDVSVTGVPCLVDSISKMSPAEISALPKKLKP